MLIGRVTALFLLASLCANANALERRYLATIDESRWMMTDYTATLCRLEHKIPLFGSVAFTREAGRPLQLELATQRHFARGINVELRSETSHWKKPETRKVLARFETSGRRQPFKISTAIAEQTYVELNQGLQPGFLFYDDSPGIASMSAVRFGQGEAQFRQCVTGLYRDNFNDVRVSSIHFAPDDEFASIKDEESAFTQMLDYLAVDDTISEIVVTGHTDHTGAACYNDGLSERRAWYVYDLLVALGIDSKLLRVDHFGEMQPTKMGGTKNSLAANRRVTVELRR